MQANVNPTFLMFSSNSRQRLQGTGSVWEVCDSVKTMSKDNRSAVLRVCFTQLQLLRDACEEIDEVKTLLHVQILVYCVFVLFINECAYVLNTFLTFFKTFPFSSMISHILLMFTNMYLVYVLNAMGVV